MSTVIAVNISNTNPIPRKLTHTPTVVSHYKVEFIASTFSPCASQAPRCVSNRLHTSSHHASIYLALICPWHLSWRRAPDRTSNCSLFERAGPAPAQVRLPFRCWRCQPHQRIRFASLGLRPARHARRNRHAHRLCRRHSCHSHVPAGPAQLPTCASSHVSSWGMCMDVNFITA